MAYAFSNIQDVLDSQNPDKQNIFGGSSGSGGASQQQGGAPGAVKTSTEGDLSGGTSGSAGTPNAQMKSQGDNGANSSRAAYTANVGKTETPYGVNYANQQLDQKQTDLQKASDDYYNSQVANQNYGVDHGTVDKAFKTGDQDAYSNIQGLLGRQNINQVGSFTPNDTNVKETNLLSTKAGQKELVKSGQDYSYTPGMASFDVAALQGNPQFQQLRNDILKKQSDLNTQASGLAVSRPKDVETAGKANLASAQAETKGYLTQNQKAILDAENAAAVEKNKALAAGKGKAGQDALAAAVIKAKAGLQQLDPQALQYLNPNIDPYSYGSVHGDYKGSDLATDEQAKQFNNISGLLGLSDMQQASIAPQSDYNFDQNGLVNALKTGAMNTWNPIKQGYEKEQSGILSQAQKAADAANAQRASLNKNKVVNDEFAKVLKRVDPSYQSELYNIQNSIGGINSFIDPNAFATFNQTPLTKLDTLNKQQADSLNALQGKLGQQNTYSAGAGAGTPYGYDQEGAFKQLMGILQPMQSSNRGEEIAKIDKELAGLKGTTEAYKNNQLSPVDADTGEDSQDVNNKASARIAQLEKQRALLSKASPVYQ